VRKYAEYYPFLNNIFHIPNGGWRAPREATILKAMGVEPGVPDIFVAVPKGQYAGLWIEFKSIKGFHRPEQKIWENNLVAVGYKVEIHRSWMTAWNSTIKYLEYPDKLLVAVPPPLPKPPRKPYTRAVK
jgi:hypothetical protein